MQVVRTETGYSEDLVRTKDSALAKAQREREARVKADQDNEAGEHERRSERDAWNRERQELLRNQLKAEQRVQVSPAGPDSH